MLPIASARNCSNQGNLLRDAGPNTTVVSFDTMQGENSILRVVALWAPLGEYAGLFSVDVIIHTVNYQPLAWGVDNMNHAMRSPSSVWHN